MCLNKWQRRPPFRCRIRPQEKRRTVMGSSATCGPSSPATDRRRKRSMKVSWRRITPRPYSESKSVSRSSTWAMRLRRSWSGSSILRLRVRTKVSKHQKSMCSTDRQPCRNTSNRQGRLQPCQSTHRGEKALSSPVAGVLHCSRLNRFRPDKSNW